MKVHFLLEKDDGLSPSSHVAAAMRGRGLSVSFDEGEQWRSAAWRKQCKELDAMVLVIYGQHDPWLLRKIARASLSGVAIVRLWVGSDCLWATRYGPCRDFARALRRLGVENWTVAGHLADELAQVGLRARCVPVVSVNVSEVSRISPLPEQFTVLAYLPARRRELYGGAIIDDLIERLPDVRFLILGDPDGDYGRHANVESLGYVEDVNETFDRCTVLVRPTLHDGMPRMVLEVVARGRYAICTHALPHAIYAPDADGIVQQIERVRNLDQPNRAGAEAVRKGNAGNGVDKLVDGLAELANRPRAMRRLAGAKGLAAVLAKNFGLIRTDGVGAHNTLDGLDPAELARAEFLAEQPVGGDWAGHE